MQIFENLASWQEEFKQGWLAHYKETGETNWKVYVRPKNNEAISGSGIDLAQSRLALITSAGGYLSGSQEPFDAANELGDYTIRTFPSSTPFDDIAYAHEHYDHTAVDADPQVLLPLRHLEDMVREGLISELAPSVISYHGYQPDVERTINTTVPAIVEVAKAEQINAALLVPA